MSSSTAPKKGLSGGWPCLHCDTETVSVIIAHVNYVMCPLCNPTLDIKAKRGCYLAPLQNFIHLNRDPHC